MRNFGHNLILFFDLFLMRRRELVEQLDQFRDKVSSLEKYIVHLAFNKGVGSPSVSTELQSLKSETERTKEAFDQFYKKATDLLEEVETQALGKSEESDD